MAAISLLLLSLNLISPQVESQADFDKRLEGMFTRTGVPGAVVRVAKDGKVVYQKAFGVSDIETKTPATEKMAFEIGSVSKHFAAVAVLLLVQEGKLKTEETLGSILPEIPASWKAATVDQTLHHMSGVPDYEEIAGYDFYNSPRQPKEIIDQAAKKEPAFKPGDKFEYSNTGYFLISMIIEKRGGMPVGQFLKKRIFDPLGMTSTYADVKPAGVVPMTGYHSRTGTRTKQPPIAWSSTLGAGGIVSTLDDLLKWDEALYTEKLVKKELLAKLWTPTKFNDGKVNTYGYGLFRATFRGVTEINHSGQTNGFTCIYRRYPDLHCSVWAFTNTYGGNVFGLARSALVRYVPGMNYAALPIPTDPDADRTKKNVALLRHCVSGGAGDFSMVSAGVKDFATNDRFANDRKELKGWLDSSNNIRFVRVLKGMTAAGVPVDTYLYRQERPQGNKYWTLGFSNGILVTLLVEDE